MSNGEELYNCPCDSCDYSHHSKRSVLSHYTAKTDSSHEGSYGHAKQLLKEQRRGEGDSDEGDSGGTVEPEEPEVPEADEATKEENMEEEVTCPECGTDEELYQADSALKLYKKKGVQLDSDQKKALKRADVACMNCGVAFDTEDDGGEGESDE